MSARIPAATYRLQFNRLFTWKHASAITAYLRELGISDIYASPLFMARKGSLHGYDVIDPTKLNPELGAREEFNEFSSLLKQQSMGLMMDVVPNHMCIAGSGNQWWNDILGNGPSSPFAMFFDIDWRPPKQNLANKTLLPVLGDQYGRVLENQEIQLVYQRGLFFATYYETRLPISPRTSILILNVALGEMKNKLEETHPHRLELESIITALSHIPPRTETDPDKVRERLREKEVAKRRLAALVADSRVAKHALKRTVKAFNGIRGEARSFDRLEELLADQAYRLCFWRVAADEINYRRFFDINELAAIRVEHPKVFAAAHELVFRLMKEGQVTGLRIDHIDGLYDPERYLRDLQEGCRRALRLAGSRASVPSSPLSSSPSSPPSSPPSSSMDADRVRLALNTERPCYVVVEKILGHGERLRETWATYGTTGYDFLNLLNGLFVDSQSEAAFHKLYRRLTGAEGDFADVAYESKKLILHAAMSSELHVLARRLDRISEQSRYTRDFTLNSLQYALGEVIACFPVYRSYIGSDGSEGGADHVGEDHAGEEDRRHISRAIRFAKRRNPAISSSTFDFIESLLLLRDPEGIDEDQRRERREFVMRFQQLTGPVTAKGIEDTAFYRFYPLASICEVGGDPSRFGVSPGVFHRRNQETLAHWPHTMLATSTHDTKRSEDARARINALSEIPARWYRAARRWQNLNRELKTTIEEQAAPDANEEYLLYQTLVGVWPVEAKSERPPKASPHEPPNEMEVHQSQAFVHRIQEYMIKALREAKVHSSWLNPDEEYEHAVRDFVAKVLSSGTFVADFLEFQAPIARAGMYNSLSQTLLKMTSPGVPDFYQGTEIWDFSLVDPDNRRPVDYEHRKRLLESLRAPAAAGVSPGRQSDRTAEETGGEDNQAALAADLIRNIEDGRIKMFATSRGLNFRRRRRDLFDQGAYLPLQATGERERHVISFARKFGDQAVIIVATRFALRLMSAGRQPIEVDAWPDIWPDVWGDTAVSINDELAGCYRDVFTGANVCSRKRADGHELPLAEACDGMPIALLERVCGSDKIL
jgi:(1->4)-alpha-D-glucan 1-alpha-D-glucosylmutase